jgi:hypothetical protein
MRFRSHSDGGDVVAVTGVNTVSFALLTTDDVNSGLLGFAVQRSDPVAGERYFMAGYKVFQSVMPNPPQNVAVGTFDQPVQSFVWDDFTAKPDQDYTYEFYPLKGKPKNLDRSTPPLTITVHTEALYTDTEHDVFFNRGVASSQAYARRFGSDPIDELKPPAKRQEAIDWLTRDLDDALLKFINSTKKGDELRGCFYEFAYPPATDALMDAIGRGVDVQIIIDEKDNKDRFPLDENQKELARSHFPPERLKARTARASVYAHNKFMVLSRGGAPQQVWTGSTNLTLSGVAGQTNVGHWVRNADIASAYHAYWDLLHDDPGARADDSPAEKRAANTAFKKAVDELSPVPDDLHDLPAGVTSIFSPRSSAAVLDGYASLLDQAQGWAASRWRSGSAIRSRNCWRTTPATTR